MRAWRVQTCRSARCERASLTLLLFPFPTLSHRSAKAAGATEIVVHCALSQVRGPACARRLNERLAAATVSEDASASSSSSRVRIAVLTGGYDGWHAVYGGDGEVTERG
jgi:rhodanese-related sulfurtransferase